MIECKRMLPCRPERAVIDHLHQREKSCHGRGRTRIAVRFHDICFGHCNVSAEDWCCDQRHFGRSKNAEAATMPEPASAPAREGRRRRVRRRAKAIAAASSQVVANSMSRQMIPTKTKAGGISASSGSN